MQLAGASKTNAGTMAKARFPTETGAQTAARILLVTRENLFGNDTERDEQIRQKQHLFAHNHADIFAAFHLPALPAQRC